MEDEVTHTLMLHTNEANRDIFYSRAPHPYRYTDLNGKASSGNGCTSEGPSPDRQSDAVGLPPGVQDGMGHAGGTRVREGQIRAARHRLSRRRGFCTREDDLWGDNQVSRNPIFNRMPEVYFGAVLRCATSHGNRCPPKTFYTVLLLARWGFSAVIRGLNARSFCLTCGIFSLFYPDECEKSRGLERGVCFETWDLKCRVEHAFAVRLESYSSNSVQHSPI